MLILEITTKDLPILKIIYFIRSLLSIISIVIPVILIVTVVIDLIKMLTNPNDSKKHIKTLTTRSIMAICVFFIPLLINFIMNLIGQTGVERLEYWNEATNDNIKVLEKKVEEENISKRNETSKNLYINKSKAIINSANNLLNKDDKIVSPEIKNELSSLIKDLENKINTSDTKTIIDSYNKLNSKVEEVKKTLPKIEENKQPEKYIFVGDSRTVMINDAVGNPENTSFVAKVGMGYSWFQSTAISSVNDIINSSDEPYYIFFNLGVNDAVDGVSANRTITNNYISSLVELSRNEWKDQRIIVLSVTPTSDNTTYNHKDSAVVEFNSLMRSGIEGNDNLLYCDVYNGIGKNNFSYEPDGLHYTNSMSKTIYEYVINNCKL